MPSMSRNCSLNKRLMCTRSAVLPQLSQPDRAAPPPLIFQASIMAFRPS
jgi:hypothetical protein